MLGYYFVKDRAKHSLATVKYVAEYEQIPHGFPILRKSPVAFESVANACSRERSARQSGSLHVMNELALRRSVSTITVIQNSHSR